MNPKEYRRNNPWFDYERELNEFGRMTKEYEKTFKEFEYQMKEFDRLNAEFDEMMKIPEIEEYKKDFENGFPFPDDPGRYKKNMDMLIRSCGTTPEEFYKYIHNRIRKSKSLDSSGY